MLVIAESKQPETKIRAMPACPVTMSDSQIDHFKQRIEVTI